MSDTTEMQTQSLVVKQTQLEKLYSKNQLMPRIRAEFQLCQEFSFITYLAEKDIPTKFGLDLLAQMALHKRANLQTLVGVLYHHFQNGQKTIDMIKRCAEAELVDWSPVLKIFIVKPEFTVSQDVQDELDRFQFPLPMVVSPKTVTNNQETGYLVSSGSLILKDNHHEDDICLDHINRLNQIKLAINHDVVKMVKNKWKNLDKPKECETAEDYEKRKRAFAKYDRVAKDVINTLTEHTDHFHLTHRYDKRGRTYSAGYHVNYQGNPWNKACIEFAEKELVE